MVIACEKCNTRFHLDDARIPKKGARVRCSRCKHAFFVRPPGATDDDTLNGIAAEAAVRPEAPPEPSSDLLDPMAQTQLSGFDPTGLDDPGTGLSASDLAAPGEDEEESDWQFNDDSDDLTFASIGEDITDAALTMPPVGQAPQAAPELAAPATPGEPDPNAITQPPSDVFADAVEEQSPPGVAPGAPELDFSEAGASEVGVPETQVLDPELHDFSIDEDGEDGAEHFDFAATNSAPEPEAAAPTPAVESLDELGSPEDWDLLGGEDEAAPPEPPREPVVPAQVPEPLPVPEPEPEPPPPPAAVAERREPREAANPNGGVERPTRTGFTPPVASEAPAEPSSRATLSAGPANRVRSLASTAGIACAVVLLAVGLVRAALPAPSITAAAQPVAASVGNLRVDGIQIRSFENALAGAVTTVTGRIAAGEGHRRGEWVRVVLRDGQGAVLPGGQLAGAVLPEGALRGDDPRALQQRHRESAAALASGSLSGEGVRFQAIFEAVPAQAADVGFEIASVGPFVGQLDGALVGPPRPETATDSGRELPSSPGE